MLVARKKRAEIRMLYSVLIQADHQASLIPKDHVPEEVYHCNLVILFGLISLFQYLVLKSKTSVIL